MNNVTLFHLLYFSKAFQVDYLILQDLMWDLNVLLSFLSSRDYNIPYKEKHHWLYQNTRIKAKAAITEFVINTIKYYLCKYLLIKQ